MLKIFNTDLNLENFLNSPMNYNHLPLCYFGFKCRYIRGGIYIVISTL